jgi:hypothetical protein
MIASAQILVDQTGRLAAAMEKKQKVDSLWNIREPILVRARKIFVLARTVQKHRNHLLSAPASCKFFALECAS